MTPGPPEDGRRAEHFPCSLRSEPPTSGDWYKELGKEFPIKSGMTKGTSDMTGRDVGHDGRESW